MKGYILKPHKLYFTTDSGVIWELDSVVTEFGLGKFSNYELTNIFIVGSKVFKTSNGGENWIEFTEVTNVGLEALSLLSAKNGYAVGETGLIMKFDETIPVELISFTSTLVENTVLLRWVTATETNNLGFVVQRKKNSENDWNDLKFVRGNGSSSEMMSYNYSDKLDVVGTYQYRLKQVDFDGSFALSEILTVELSPPESFKLFQNYPNPFNSNTTIKFYLPVKSYVTVKIYDSLGQEVTTSLDRELVAGIYDLILDAKEFASSVYIYKLNALDINGENFTASKKMILLK